MGRGKHSPNKPCFHSLGCQSNSQTTPGMASVGLYACYNHGISIHPTFISSSSPTALGHLCSLQNTKFLLISPAWKVFYSHLHVSILPFLAGPGNPLLTTQCLPCFFSAFFFSAHSLSSEAVSRVCQFCSQRADPKERAGAVGWHWLTHPSAHSAPFFPEEFHAAHWMGNC